MRSHFRQTASVWLERLLENFAVGQLRRHPGVRLAALASVSNLRSSHRVDCLSAISEIHDTFTCGLHVREQLPVRQEKGYAADRAKRFVRRAEFFPEEIHVDRHDRRAWYAGGCSCQSSHPAKTCNDAAARSCFNEEVGGRRENDPSDQTTPSSPSAVAKNVEVADGIDAAGATADRFRSETRRLNAAGSRCTKGIFYVGGIVSDAASFA